jgi:hypothetical protein
MTHIVRISIALLATALGSGLLLLFGHALAIEVIRRRRTPRIEAGRSALYALLSPASEDSGSQESRTVLLERLRRLSGAEQEAVIAPIARRLSPEACAPLSVIADEVGLLDRASRWCRSRRWWMRLRGARLCSSLCSTGPLMLDLMNDSHPAVRAQAADWAARSATPEVVERLLEMVDDSAALSRFAVQDALVRLGNQAVEPLASFLEKRSGPEIEPAIRVAATIPHPLFLNAAIRHAESEQPAVRACAMRLLGSIGGPEVARQLERHLEDPSADVRSAAVRALGRIGQWTRAPEMAARLRDTSWDVRRSAGLALRELGSPGVLMLRRMTTDENRFAADMALQVLDLPAGLDGIAS